MATTNNSVNELLINGTLKTGTTAGNTAVLSAYDTTAAAQDTFATMTAGADPTLTLSGFNRTGSTYTNFMTVTSTTTATCDLADSVTKASNYIYRAGGTDVAIADGGTGISTTPTDGQLLIGKTSTNNYSLATLTAGTNISITNGGGTISIAATGSGVPWTPETSGSFSAVANNGYVISYGSLVTVTLPVTAAFGTIIRITDIGGHLFTIAQNSGQYIYCGLYKTTTGVGGSLTSISTHDAIELICTIADTEFTVLSSMGNFTVV